MGRPASVGRVDIALVGPERQTTCMENLDARVKAMTRHRGDAVARHLGHADEPCVVVPPQEELPGD